MTPVKVVVSGPPAAGKTTVAWLIANAMRDAGLTVELINDGEGCEEGRHVLACQEQLVTIETVRT